MSGFKATVDSVKPHVYWYWINDNISKGGAVRDLKAMAEAGIGGAFHNEFHYNPLPWLPVLTGCVMGSADQSNRFCGI